MISLTLLIDTREQLPLPFTERHIRVHLDRAKKPTLFHIKCKERKLDVGDYAFEGYELLCPVETKRSPDELYNNLLTDDFERSQRAFSRLLCADHPILVCEFSQASLVGHENGKTMDAISWLISSREPGMIVWFAGPRSASKARNCTVDCVLRLMIPYVWREMQHGN